MSNHDLDQPEEPGLDISALDEAILSRIRLGVMAYLSSSSPATFPELAKQLQTTNGNLSTHLTKLEKAGYVDLEKGYNGKRPQTLVHLTDDGRAIWLKYLGEMEKLLGT
jgi:DNA-binding MarR family transcriptional regulator